MSSPHPFSQILKPSEKKAKYQYGGVNSGRPVTPPRTSQAPKKRWAGWPKLSCSSPWPVPGPRPCKLPQTLSQSACSCVNRNSKSVFLLVLWVFLWCKWHLFHFLWCQYVLNAPLHILRGGQDVKKMILCLQTNIECPLSNSKRLYIFLPNFLCCVICAGYFAVSCRILETPSVEMFVSVVLRGREIKTEKLNSKVFRNHNPVSQNNAQTWLWAVLCRNISCTASNTAPRHCRMLAFTHGLKALACNGS